MAASPSHPHRSTKTEMDQQPALTRSLPAGELHVHLRREEMPLAQLLDFATRRNPKRAFLFVSRVLGKHLPCRPSHMQAVQTRLAHKIPDHGEGPYLVVGMAETATALGSGVAHALAAHIASPVLGLRTTRYRLQRKPDVVVEESHSHAMEHLLYVDPAHHPRLQQAKTLVLVDDEITTGRTLARLAQALLERLPACRQILFLSLVSWLSRQDQKNLEDKMGRACAFDSLLEGDFHFTAHPDWSPGPLISSEGNKNILHEPLLTDPTRLGMVTEGQTFILPPWRPPAGPLTLIGDGEYMYPPFQLALALEQAGQDVLFQSTTRSPILPGGAITQTLTFQDHYGDDIPHFLYNWAGKGRTSLLMVEHPQMLAHRSLIDQIGGMAIAMSPHGHVIRSSSERMN